MYDESRWDGYERRRDRARAPIGLAYSLDRQEYVRFDPQRELLYCWNGSLTVNVYDLTGACVAMWTLEGSGDEPRHELRESAITSIVERIEGKEADDDDED